MTGFSKNGIRRGVERIYRRFLKLRGEPHAIAMGMALGVFVGMSPLMGIHSVIAVAVAAIFKWSKIAALIGVFVTNPLTAPLIYPLTYALGALILGNPVTPGGEGLALKTLLHSSPTVLSNLLVGGAIIGLAGGSVSYVIALRTIRTYRQRRQRLRDDGKAPFAAVRRRLMRVARRQRRKSRRKAIKSLHTRQARRSRRRRPAWTPAG